MSNTFKMHDVRSLMAEALRLATLPERTGAFSFDGFDWREDYVLKVSGDHGTPDFEFQFIKPDCVTIVCRNGYNDTHTSFIDWGNLNRWATQVVHSMRVLSDL